LLGRWPRNGSKSPPWSICRASVRVKEDGRKRKEKGGEISSMCWAGPTHVVCGSRPARACVITSRKMNPPSEGQHFPSHNRLGSNYFLFPKISDLVLSIYTGVSRQI
jgi:hypothetical protein